MNTPSEIASKPVETAVKRSQALVSCFLATLIVGALAFTTGCQTYPKVVGTTDGPYDLTNILPGDTLSISFPGAPELNATIKVPIDGEISLPAAIAKPVNALGKTRSELEKAIVAVVGKDLNIPEVNVSLVTSAAVVYVTGAVMAPNKIPMDRPLTLMDALMEAGGPNMATAKLDSVSIVRNIDGEQKSLVIDMRPAFSGGNVPPCYLRPFDSIVVPERTFRF